MYQCTLLSCNCTSMNNGSKAYNILLVEDEVSLQQLYNELLLSEGYIVDTATDGSVALTMLQNGSYDLVLLDIRLPELDGLQILKKLTPDDKIRNPKIYMMTQFDTQSIIEEAYSHGASGYLMKSALTPADVIQEVKAAFKSA